jgi:DUF1365 family protein
MGGGGVSLASGLYVGSVIHHRLGARPHRFRYRLYWLLLDLDELPRLNRFKLFGHNRRAVFSLNDRDHGDGSATTLRAQVEALARRAGVDLRGGAIRLLTTPRTLGYAFNPLSVYFCHAPDGTLSAIVYEVHNTFGERHSYALRVLNADDVRQGCAKAFFVSPFLPMGLSYAFHVSPPGERLALAIRVSDAEGVVLRAALAGDRRELTDAALMRAGLSIPAVGLKTMAAIHWEAARLWLKGVRFLGRPAPARPLARADRGGWRS